MEHLSQGKNSKHYSHLNERTFMKRLILFIYTLTACLLPNAAFALENFCPELQLIEQNKHTLANMDLWAEKKLIKDLPVVEQVYQAYYKFYREALMASQTDNAKAFYDILGKCELPEGFVQKELTSDEFRNMVPEATYNQIMEHIKNDDLFDSTKYKISMSASAVGFVILVVPVFIAGVIYAPFLIVGAALTVQGPLFWAFNKMPSVYQEFHIKNFDEATMSAVEQSANNMASSTLKSLLRWDERQTTIDNSKP